MRLTEHDSWQSFRLPSEHRQALRRVAREAGCSVSELLREAVEIIVRPDAGERAAERLENPFIRAARRRTGQSYEGMIVPPERSSPYPHVERAHASPPT
jgi:hypothetical protein